MRRYPNFCVFPVRLLQTTPVTPTMKPFHWLTQGSEPDYRFSLANERTFLSWIRTALALLAAGVLLEQFSHVIPSHRATLVLALLLCVLAAALCALAYWRWRSNEIAMRHARPLPGNPAIPLLAAGMLCVGTVVCWALLAR